MSQRLDSSTPAPAVAVEPWWRRGALLWGALGLDAVPRVYGLTRAGSRRIWTPDLVVLATLVALTAVFGGAVRNVRLPGASNYLTGEQARQLYEPAIALIILLALWRLRREGTLRRLRTTLPLIPLGLLWLAGAISTVRGLAAFGTNQILPDIGLVEYSIFLPLVALVVDSRERAVRLLAVVSAAGLVATIGFGILWEFDSTNILLVKDPYSAITISIALFVLPVLARLALRSRVLPIEILLGAIALVLISVTVVRSAVFALGAALAAMVLLMPRDRRVLALAIAVCALTISVGGALAVEKSNQIRNVGGAPITKLVAGDSSPEFSGGSVVEGDAAEGKAARRLRLREPLEMNLILQPGVQYTILFAVKPLQPVTTYGFVGNPSGIGWGQTYWTAAPIMKWQFFRKTLKATTAAEQLSLSAQFGSPSVLFDAIRVLKGKHSGWSGDYLTGPVDFGRRFVASDADAPLFGGRSLTGGAARGRVSRLLARKDQLGITLTGLRPGKDYTVRFAVKPVTAVSTSGFVGDPAGLGWGQQYWKTAPDRSWQAFKKILRPTSTTEKLVFSPQYGASEVQFDAIKVLKGAQPGPAGDFVVREAVANPDFVADDAATLFSGGERVRGNAAEGRFSRRLALKESLSLPLSGLVRGRTYTILFAVKPLRPVVTSGLVGNATGVGWGQAYWTAAPIAKWQLFSKKLRARGPTDQLALIPQLGSPAVLFDAIRVLKGGRPGWSGDYQAKPLPVGRRLVADDADAPFFGGRSVTGDAARGRVSRSLVRKEQLKVALTGLEPRQTYTVRFAVKPLSPVVTRGLVGNPNGVGWGSRYWATAPKRRWQPFDVTLTARSTTEQLALMVQQGARRVLFDAIELARGGKLPPPVLTPTRPVKPAHPPAPAKKPAAPPAKNPPPPPEKHPKPSAKHPPPPRVRPKHPAPALTKKHAPSPGAPLPLAADFESTFGGSDASGANVSWRLAIWRHMLGKTLHDPVFGVGFGQPTNFRWKGIRYDGRVGDTSNSFDVVAPHNSFVNLLYRTGLLGFLALLALVVIAAVRVVRALRSPQLAPLDRVLLVGCGAVFVFTIVISSFNVALEAPFMALFFWLFLGLLLVLPRILGSTSRAARRESA